MAVMKKDPNKVLPPHEASKEVFDNYHRSEREVVSKRREQFKLHYQLYRSVLKQKDNKLMSQVVIPLVMITIEDIIPRLVANRPKIEAQPRGDEDANRAAKSRALISYFWDIIPMAIRLIEFVKQAQIYGTAVMKVAYKQKEETRITRVAEESPTFMGLQIPSFFGGGGTRSTFAARPVIVWDDPVVDNCEIDQIFPDPDGIDIDSCTYITHRIKADLDDLLAARRDGEPMYKTSVLEEAKKLGSKMNPLGQMGTQTLADQIKSEYHGITNPAADQRKTQFHILEQWTDSKITVCIEEFPQLPPIRSEFNDLGQKPFVRFTPVPDPNKFYGISQAELLHSMQVEISTLHSANIDNVLYGVHQMYKVLRTSGINARNLRFRPGGVIPVKDMGDIQPLEKSYQDLSLYRATDDIRRWVQRIGTTDTFAGVASDLSGRTATEASILSEASSSKAGLMFQILSIQTLTPLGHLVNRLYELNLDSTRSVRIAGDDFSQMEYTRVSPDDLVNRTGMMLDIIIDIAQTEPMNQQFKLMRAKDMLQSFGAIGLQRNDPVVKYILAELLRAYGKNNPEALLGSPESQAVEDQAAAAALPTGNNFAGDDIEGLAQQLAADQGG